jgi:signal transduction histidine kinase
VGLAEEMICGRSMAEIGVRLFSAGQQDLSAVGKTDRAMQNVEAQLERRDREPIHVVASMKPMTLQQEHCILLTLQDLTDIRRLKKEVIDISEEEQRRFSRDLHDSHCQDLTAMVFFAEDIATTLDAIDPKSASQVRALSQMIERSAENVRSLAANLASQRIEQAGLEDTLSELAVRTEERFRVICSTTVTERGRIRDAALGVHLYRIAQEAVSNAARHGRAQKIEIELSFRGETGVLRIADNGSGFSNPDSPQGFGLHTMEYRAAAVKGKLEIDSTPGRGTVVTCLFPVG